jgi:hypothetical protein
MFQTVEEVTLMRITVRGLSVLLLVLAIICSFQPVAAQGPKGKNFGFGIILGDPLGGTVKYWLNKENALTGSIGASYFGAPRLQVDYLWHFDAFSSSVVKMYAGPGLGLGFGSEGSGIWYKGKRGNFYYRDGDDGLGIAVRAVFGLNIVPKRSPLEIFAELGPNVGLIPGFGVAIDAAVGVRFYP